jgi:hypothetical protein
MYHVLLMFVDHAFLIYKSCANASLANIFPGMQSGAEQVELGHYTIQVLDGYPSLAKYIASDPDQTNLIFKKFSELSARNLLYFQSELLELQAQQAIFDQDDAAIGASMSTKDCARNWERFKEKAFNEPKDQDQVARFELAMKIRHTLHRYRMPTVLLMILSLTYNAEKAIIFESTIASLSSPPQRTLEAFRHEFYRSKSSRDEGFSLLGGQSARLLEDESDLIALRSMPNEDRLTKLIRDHFPVLFKV